MSVTDISLEQVYVLEHLRYLVVLVVFGWIEGHSYVIEFMDRYTLWPPYAQVHCHILQRDILCTFFRTFIEEIRVLGQVQENAVQIYL